MWENAAKHTDTPPAPPAAAEPGEYDTLLWAQIILCVLIAAGVFAARALELPLYSTLRTDYRYALAQPGPDFWNTDGSRNVVRFTQETFAELRGVLRQVTAQTPETAARTGTVHGQPLASAEAYLPGVMLQYPLPGKPAVETSAYGTRIDPVQGKTTGVPYRCGSFRCAGYTGLCCRKRGGAHSPESCELWQLCPSAAPRRG